MKISMKQLQNENRRLKAQSAIHMKAEFRECERANQAEAEIVRLKLYIANIQSCKQCNRWYHLFTAMVTYISDPFINKNKMAAMLAANAIYGKEGK